MDSEGALRSAAAQFERLLAGVAVDQWDHACCGEWTVRQTANHTVGSLRMYAMLLCGADGTELAKRRDEDHLGPQPAAALRAAVEDLAIQLRRPGALEGTVSHPAGDLPAPWLAIFSVEELVVHGCDVASATGNDATIDETLAEWLLTPLAGIIEPFRAAGRFKDPGGDGPEGVSAAARLLHLTGR